MADETKAEEQPQAGAPAPPVGSDSGPEPSRKEESPDPRVEAANREAAKYRRELRDLQAWKEQQDAAQLTEAQRIQQAAEKAEARAKTAEERTRSAELRAAVLTYAPAVNLLPAAYEDALKLLNADLIEWDADTGQPTRASVKRALEALVKDRPYLIATTPAPAPGPAAFAPHGNGAAIPDAQGQANQMSISGRW